MQIILKPEDAKRWNIHDKIGCVYLIRNLVNQKVYIGSTGNLRKRVSEYTTAHKLPYGNKRQILYAIQLYGTDNFTLEILENTDDYSLMYDLENKYIRLYKSTDPNYGYNQIRAGHICADEYKTTNLAKSLSHIGLIDRADTKRKKSNMIIAIGDNKVIISDSGKLFGDYVGVSKDMVKNGLREPSSIRGYMLFYDDFYKRQVIRNKMYSKKCIRKPEYMNILNLLDNLEYESVETIYNAFRINFGQIYKLRYIDEPGNPKAYALDMIQANTFEETSVIE